MLLFTYSFSCQSRIQFMTNFTPLSSLALQQIQPTQHNFHLPFPSPPKHVIGPFIYYWYCWVAIVVIHLIDCIDGLTNWCDTPDQWLLWENFTMWVICAGVLIRPVVELPSFRITRNNFCHNYDEIEMVQSHTPTPIYPIHRSRYWLSHCPIV